MDGIKRCQDVETAYFSPAHPRAPRRTVLRATFSLRLGLNVRAGVRLASALAAALPTARLNILVYLSSSEGHGEGEVGVDPADLDGDALARCGSLDKVILQVGSVEDLRAIDSENDIVLLNASGFGRVRHVLDRDTQFGTILHAV